MRDEVPVAYSLVFHSALSGEMPVKKEKKPKVEGEQNARGSAFKRPEPITEALQRFLKTSETQMVRADVVCKMWKYIKDRGLQVGLEPLTFWPHAADKLEAKRCRERVGFELAPYVLIS